MHHTYNVHVLAKTDLPQAQKPKPAPPPLWLKVIAGILLGGIIIVGVASWYAGRIARRYLVEAIATHYQSRVELRSFEVAIFPRILIHGEELALHNNPDPAAPPFIKISGFTADAGIRDLLRKKKRIRLVTLQGLEINVVHNSKPKNEEEEHHDNKVPEFVIEKVRADDTRLSIYPRDPNKDPRVWEIHQLSLETAGPNDSMRYKATLTNPTPPGRIESTGIFGPFNVEDTGKSPLKGDYRFLNANLGHFNGIAGVLSSTGSFSGVLETIDVKGKCDIPNFSVGRGNPVHLDADFVAVVDGTDGDTYLNQVQASFRQTKLSVSGKIEGSSGRKGKTIALKADSQQARVEDLIGLVIPDQPPIAGPAEFDAQFQLPPGKGKVLDRLRLNGTFKLSHTKFSKNSIQQQIAKLSARAQGNTSNSFSPEDTASDFAGQFTLNNGIAQFSRLNFYVPGASVDLAGTYNLNNESLDFQGRVHFQAKLSEMTTGAKSFFAKLAQPLLKGKKGKGNTQVPIKISGTRKQPNFGIDVGKVFQRD